MALSRRQRQSTSINTLSIPTMFVSYVLLFAWSFVVLFPLYWLAVTSLKTPLDVNAGPFYIPFRDFQPNLDNWHYIFVDLGEDTAADFAAWATLKNATGASYDDASLTLVSPVAVNAPPLGIVRLPLETFTAPVTLVVPASVRLPSRYFA